MQHLTSSSRRPFPFTLAAAGPVVGVVVASLGFCGAAAAQHTIGMPAGSRSWIEAHARVVGGLCCFDSAGGVGAIPDPSPNYELGAIELERGYFIYANADARANRLRVAKALRFSNDAKLHNSMLDTYTITGPPGSQGTPVAARLRMQATGTIFVGPTFGGIHVGLSALDIAVGGWNPSTAPNAAEDTRVTPFGPTADFSMRAMIPHANHGATRPTLAVDLLIDQTLTRTVGTPFDIAFGLHSYGRGTGNLAMVPSPGDDGYVVATIDWDLPPGYSITSVLEWTDPDACVADVDDGTGTGMPDGGVTIDDLLYYLSIFDQGLLAADVDDGSGTGTPDGGVTIDDLLFYLARFDAGC